MKWQPVIGLEIHARLKTRSKLFSGAATGYGAAPTPKLVQACAVNVALPGVLPAGFDDGLPVGMQLIGNHFSEASLLALGHRYQRETDRHRRVPPAFG